MNIQIVEELVQSNNINEIKDLLKKQCENKLHTGDWDAADLIADLLFQLDRLGKSDEWNDYISIEHDKKGNYVNIEQKLIRLEKLIVRAFDESSDFFLWVKDNHNSIMPSIIVSPNSQFKSHEIWRDIPILKNKPCLDGFKATFVDMLRELNFYHSLSYEGNPSLFRFASGLEIKKGRFYDFFCKMQKMPEIKKLITDSINHIDRYIELLDEFKKLKSNQYYTPLSQLLPKIKSILCT